MYNSIMATALHRPRGHPVNMIGYEMGSTTFNSLSLAEIEKLRAKESATEAESQRTDRAMSIIALAEQLVLEGRGPEEALEVAKEFLERCEIVIECYGKED